MIGWVTWLPWVLAVLGLGQYAGLFRLIPINRKIALLIGLGGLAWGLYNAGVFGAFAVMPESTQTSTVAMPKFDVTAQAAAPIKVSDNIITVPVEYNSTDGKAYLQGTTSSEVDVNFLVRRIDDLSDKEVAVVHFSVADVPTVYDKTAEKSYSIIPKGADDKYMVEWFENGTSIGSPEGVTAIKLAGSTTVTGKFQLNSDAIAALDVLGSKDVTLNVAGQTFTLRIVRVA